MLAGMKLGIIDYGGGNLQSVRNALRTAGAEAADYVRSPEELEGVELLVFPGQGAFGDSMEALRSRGLVEPIREWIAADRPFLGICVGYQALFERSEEDPGVEGLGVFKGEVVRFKPLPGVKVPHMGWNEVRLVYPQDPQWQGLGTDPHFYFVHSYYPVPEDASLVAGETEYNGGRFASAIQRGNLTATQFHPEKSQSAGLALLENFLKRHQVPATAGV